MGTRLACLGPAEEVVAVHRLLWCLIVAMLAEDVDCRRENGGGVGVGVLQASSTLWPSG